MTMIEVLALKTFPYSLDGLSIRIAEACALVWLPEWMAKDLRAEGFVVPAEDISSLPAELAPDAGAVVYVSEAEPEPAPPRRRGPGRPRKQVAA